MNQPSRERPYVISVPPCREEPTRQPRFVHEGNVTYPTQGAHTTNVVVNASTSNAFVKLIGDDSMDGILVQSDAAHFPEPSVVPAGQSADEVCGEEPRLVAVNEVFDGDAGLRFSFTYR